MVEKIKSERDIGEGFKDMRSFIWKIAFGLACIGGFFANSFSNAQDKQDTLIQSKADASVVIRIDQNNTTAHNEIKQEMSNMRSEFTTTASNLAKEQSDIKADIREISTNMKILIGE
jgi:esterase/lipase